MDRFASAPPPYVEMRNEPLNQGGVRGQVFFPQILLSETKGIHR